MISFEEAKIIKLMTAKDGLIDVGAAGGIYPVYARGNRRRKPLCWIEKAVMAAWQGRGWLTYCGDMLALEPSFLARFSQPHEDKAHSAQHRDMDTKPVYTPCGSERAAPLNHKISVLRWLGRRRNTHGQPLLTQAQLEAGEHFARDYTLGGLGQIGSQSYDSPIVDAAFRADRQEMAIISRMDRRRRISEAMSCLGPDLDRALIAVCCENWSLAHLERTENWAKNTGLTVLRMGLSRLVKFYGTEPGQAA